MAPNSTRSTTVETTTITSTGINLNSNYDNQGVSAVLAALTQPGMAWTATSGTCQDLRVAQECTYQDFMMATSASAGKVYVGQKSGQIQNNSLRYFVAPSARSTLFDDAVRNEDYLSKLKKQIHKEAYKTHVLTRGAPSCLSRRRTNLFPIVIDYQKLNKLTAPSLALPEGSEDFIHRILLRSSKRGLCCIDAEEKGFHSPLDEGTRSSNPLRKGKPTDAKDPEGNMQPAGLGLPSTSLDEGIRKTSSEVELNTQTLLLIIAADVQDLLLSDDELIEESDDDVFKAKPVSQEHQSPTPNKEKPESSHAKETKASDSESSLCLETFKPYDNYMSIFERQLVRNIQHISEVLYAQVVEDNWRSIKKLMAQTNKLVQETMSNLDKISKARVDKRAKLLKSLNRFSETLEADSTLKEEMKKMAESNTAISGNISNLTELLRNA
ncbi:hypothetical protein Tco_0347961 [Tanacetum coccineum]